MGVDELAERRYEVIVLKYMDWLRSEGSYVVAVSKIEDVPDWRIHTGISRDGSLVWVTEEP